MLTDFKLFAENFSKLIAEASDAPEDVKIPLSSYKKFMELWEQESQYGKIYSEFFQKLYPNEVNDYEPVGTRITIPLQTTGDTDINDDSGLSFARHKKGKSHVEVYQQIATVLATGKVLGTNPIAAKWKDKQLSTYVDGIAVSKGREIKVGKVLARMLKDSLKQVTGTNAKYADIIDMFNEFGSANGGRYSADSLNKFLEKGTSLGTKEQPNDLIQMWFSKFSGMWTKFTTMLSTMSTEESNKETQQRLLDQATDCFAIVRHIANLRKVIIQFNNDDARTNSHAGSGMNLVISHHPKDVSHMSTGRANWDSCQIITNELNEVSFDIKLGSIVCYCVPADDSAIEHPYGRVMIKQFVPINAQNYSDRKSDNNIEDFFVRVEESIYGNIPATVRKDFMQHVNNFVDKFNEVVSDKASVDTFKGEKTKRVELYDDDTINHYKPNSKEQFQSLPSVGTGRYQSPVLSEDIIKVENQLIKPISEKWEEVFYEIESYVIWPMAEAFESTPISKFVTNHVKLNDEYGSKIQKALELLLTGDLISYIKEFITMLPFDAKPLEALVKHKDEDIIYPVMRMLNPAIPPSSAMNVLSRYKVISDEWNKSTQINETNGTRNFLEYIEVFFAMKVVITVLNNAHRFDDIMKGFGKLYLSTIYTVGNSKLDISKQVENFENVDFYILHSEGLNATKKVMGNYLFGSSNAKKLFLNSKIINEFINDSDVEFNNKVEYLKGIKAMISGQKTLSSTFHKEIVNPVAKINHTDVEASFEQLFKSVDVFEMDDVEYIIKQLSETVGGDTETNFNEDLLQYIETKQGSHAFDTSIMPHLNDVFDAVLTTFHDMLGAESELSNPNKICYTFASIIRAYASGRNVKGMLAKYDSRIKWTLRNVISTFEDFHGGELMNTNFVEEDSDYTKEYVLTPLSIITDNDVLKVKTIGELVTFIVD